MIFSVSFDRETVSISSVLARKLMFHFQFLFDFILLEGLFGEVNEFSELD